MLRYSEIQEDKDLCTKNPVPLERDVSFHELKSWCEEGKNWMDDSLIWNADIPITSHLIFCNSSSVISRSCWFRSLIDCGLYVHILRLLILAFCLIALPACVWVWKSGPLFTSVALVRGCQCALLVACWSLEILETVRLCFIADKSSRVANLLVGWCFIVTPSTKNFTN